MARAVAASGVQIVTVALRRFDRDRPDDALLTPLLAMEGVTLMPNTSGARNAEEAIQAARIARELCGSRLVKVEIHPNPRHLMPDPIETYEAARVLAADGWLVMPYIPPDPVLAKRLEEVGCASVMPLGAAIGSGQGLASAELLKIIVSEAHPRDRGCGLRAPSQPPPRWRWAVTQCSLTRRYDAGDPPAMAAAFAQAVAAGRSARRAGLMPVGQEAQASSPLTAFLQGGERV